MKEKRIEKRKIKEIKKEQAKRKKVATQGLGRFSISSSPIRFLVVDFYK